MAAVVLRLSSNGTAVAGTAGHPPCHSATSTITDREPWAHVPESTACRRRLMTRV